MYLFSDQYWSLKGNTIEHNFPNNKYNIPPIINTKFPNTYITPKPSILSIIHNHALQPTNISFFQFLESWNEGLTPLDQVCVP